MKNSIKYLLFSCLIALTVSAGLTACGGSGDSDAGGAQSLNETTVIFGNVADVLTAKAPAENNKSFFTLIKDFLTPTLKAEAQGSEEEGILVTVEVNGEVIASDFTDSEGNFEFVLEGGGEIMLTFTTEEFTTSINIFIPEDGVVELVVTLEPEEVIIQESETEFSGIVTEVDCPFIIVDGSFVVDTTDTDIEGDDSALNCEDLEVGAPVEVEGEIDLATGLVIADNIEADSEDGEDDDADEEEDEDDGDEDDEDEDDGDEDDEDEDDGDEDDEDEDDGDEDDGDEDDGDEDDGDEDDGDEDDEDEDDEDEEGDEEEGDDEDEEVIDDPIDDGEDGDGDADDGDEEVIDDPVDEDEDGDDGEGEGDIQ